MLHYAKNAKLEIAVRQPGAELFSIKSLKTGLEYMWGSDPSVWNSSAPILFPIVGGLKDNAYLWNGEKYELKKHGFIRENQDLLLTGITSDSLTFGMASNKETLKIYPFEFGFTIKFILEDTKIRVVHEVTNTGKSPLFFSLGGHPGFKCPRHENEKYEDYYLEFESKENSSTWLLFEDGTVSDKTAPVFNNSDNIPLTHELFSKDALIFKDLKSKKITLRSKKSVEALSVAYADFPNMGIWAKTNGDFVCIEPWLGIADKWDTDQRLENKEGVIQLVAGGVFEAQYIIEIHE
ncbi:MAG: aldose 1-epimerase family protein [Prolixibacteraceae bacterium]|jgi:galactose mutarotase-like enzyme|nr:aldose 1-epimerase family protein [Prolixibacteraceae bacterium]